MFVRDDIHLNKLLGNKYESDPSQVRQSIVDALFDWNTSDPPITPVSLAAHPAKHLIIRKAAIELLKSAGLWHSREHMPSSDGGTSADDHAKIAEYAQWMQMIERDYEMKKTNMKVSINVASCYGGLSSEYNYEYFDSDHGRFGDNKIQNTSSESDPFDPFAPSKPCPPSGGGGTPVSPTKKIDEFSILFNEGSFGATTPIITIPANHIVIEVRVVVITPFIPSGNTPTLIIGDDDVPDRHAKSFQSDLSEAGTYIISSGHVYTVGTPITVNMFNAPTSGTGVIVVRYDDIDA